MTRKGQTRRRFDHFWRISLSQIIILLIFLIIIYYEISLTRLPPTISLSCESLPLFEFHFLFVGHEQGLLAPPLPYGLYSFTSASSMGLHMSTMHVFYPWEPCISLLSNTIDHTLLLGLF